MYCPPCRLPNASLPPEAAPSLTERGEPSQHLEHTGRDWDAETGAPLSAPWVS